jgi:DNA repair protein RadC
MSLAITAWAEADRPREKMLLKGRQALSDAELLAILIGSGTVGQSAVGLAQEILQKSSNNLHELGKKSLKDLEKHKGIGEAKAITIAAALELGRRRQLTDIIERPKIASSRDAFNVIAPLLTDLHQEQFWILLLNQANEVLSKEMMSQGGMAGTVVDIKLIYKAAIEAKAANIIAIHNHPSGNLKPSKEDINITQKLKEAGELLDIKLLDHLIVSERGYYSFADQGLLS